MRPPRLEWSLPSSYYLALNLSQDARFYNIMSKKNLTKPIAPLPVLGKSSKKGKASLDNLIDNTPQMSIEASSEEAPRLKKLRKLGKKEQQEKQKLIEEKSSSVHHNEDSQGEQESESEPIEYEKFRNADDEDIAKMLDEDAQKKGKKGKGKSKGKNIKKGEQEIDKFVEKHPIAQQKIKKEAPKPQTQTQLNLKWMFKSIPQPSPPKIQPPSSKMEEQKSNGSSDSEDSMEIFRKRQAMAKMSEQVNAGLSQQEALRQAMRESMKDNKVHKEQTPIQNYSFNAKKNDVQPLKGSLAKKQEPPAKKQTKEPKKEEKKKRSRSRSRKQQKQQSKSGPLKGLGIVTTGQFQNYSKNRILELLEKLGADLPKSITKKTTHLLQGSHIENAFKRRTDQDVKTTAKSLEAAQKNVTIIAYDDLDNFFIEKTGKSLGELMEADRPKKDFGLDRFVEINKVASAAKTMAHDEVQEKEGEIEEEKKKEAKSGISVPWTEKYKPKSSEEIIGQVSQVKNLREWLQVWQDIHIRGNKRDVKPNFNAFMPSGTINSNAALLSGDAGLGKTTTARLVANQFGYSVIEYNASDARNKKSVELISAGRNNMTFLNDKSKEMLKTLIIMDEVDGMSSGDRGGISAIIDMIKKTRVPIICICNDRQATKIRSLAGHCYDIKFHKPDKRMIAKRLQRIIELEGGKSSIVALEAIVELLQNDIRQILTYLEVIFKGGITHINADVIERRCGNTKDNSLTMNHFEATKRLLSRTMFKDMTISQRVDLAFVDSDMVPLMVQQNYLAACAKKKMSLAEFRKLTNATEGFVKADLLEKTIMRNQNYCLMPNKMFLTCVYPCEMVSENLGFPKFTQWLGKFSSQRKNKRLIKELKYALSSVSLVTSHSVKHNFVPMLLERIYQGLKEPEPDTEQIVEFMLHYGITPAILTEHLSCLQYGERENLLKNVETSKKTKLTKTYNKMCEATKFKKHKEKVVVEHLKFDPVLGEMEAEGDDGAEEEGEDSKAEQISDIVVAKKADKSKAKKKK